MPCRQAHRPELRRKTVVRNSATSPDVHVAIGLGNGEVVSISVYHRVSVATIGFFQHPSGWAREPRQHLPNRVNTGQTPKLAPHVGPDQADPAYRLAASNRGSAMQRRVRRRVHCRPANAPRSRWEYLRICRAVPE